MMPVLFRAELMMNREAIVNGAGLDMTFVKSAKEGNFDRGKIAVNSTVTAIADKAVISLEYFSITRLIKVNNTRPIAKNISQGIMLIKYS